MLINLDIFYLFIVYIPVFVSLYLSTAWLLKLINTCWRMLGFQNFGDASKSCGTIFEHKKHASSLDELLCQIWSFKAKRVGVWNDSHKFGSAQSNGTSMWVT